MASLRRTRTMPTDGAVAKFLYTILKQLDLKSVDWPLVASTLSITNGHAARMRFSRLKQQMEGLAPKPQIRPKTPRRNKRARGAGTAASAREAGELRPGGGKAEEGGREEKGGERGEGLKPEAEAEAEVMEGILDGPPAAGVKLEEAMEGVLVPGRAMAEVMEERAQVADYLPMTEDPSCEARDHILAGAQETALVKPEPVVKEEPKWGE